MSLKRLSDTGNFDGSHQELVMGPVGVTLDKRAILVYEGKFKSMDGDVNVTKSDLMLLHANHNAQLSHSCRLSGCGPRDLAMKDYPPLQLDHSTSARDTVGRLVGEIELGPYIRKDGKEVLGVYGMPRMIGAENCEKVADGRWTNLSVGVDFTKGQFSELTITPFSAAPEASFLSREKGEAMDEKLKARLKKHLTEFKKMSEEDAEKHLAKCSEDTEEMSKLSAEADEEEKRLSMDQDALSKKLSAEKEENEKKLAAEKEEDEKKLAAEKEEKESKLSAARANITKLSTDFRASHNSVKLAAQKGKIMTRLSALRSDAKITPAEIKKMDITKLAAESPETISAVLKVIEDREPVIIPGQLGSIKADELHTLSSKTRLSQLEAETRANMSLLKGTVKADDVKRLSAEAANLPVYKTSPDVETACAEVEKMMDEGKTKEAKLKMRDIVKTAMSYGSSSQDRLSAVETEKQISELAETVNKMQTQFEELHQVAVSLAGTN